MKPFSYFLRIAVWTVLAVPRRPKTTTYGIPGVRRPTYVTIRLVEFYFTRVNFNPLG